VTPRVLQPSPLKEISSRDYEGREVKGEQRSVIDHFSDHKGRRGHFLSSRVGIVPTIGENLHMGTSLSVGSAMTPLLGKRMKGKHSNSLVKPQGQGSMITKTSRSELGQSNGHTSHLKSQ
jgi:hypothetical protein